MRRAVRNLLRLIACAAAVFGVIELGLEFFRAHFHEGQINWPACLTGAALIAAGITLFALSAKLAAKWTDDFEE